MSEFEAGEAEVGQGVGQFVRSLGYYANSAVTAVQQSGERIRAVAEQERERVEAHRKELAQEVRENREKASAEQVKLKEKRDQIAKLEREAKEVANQAKTLELKAQATSETAWKTGSSALKNEAEEYKNEASTLKNTLTEIEASKTDLEATATLIKDRADLFDQRANEEADKLRYLDNPAPQSSMPKNTRNNKEKGNNKRKRTKSKQSKVNRTTEENANKASSNPKDWSFPFPTSKGLADLTNQHASTATSGTSLNSGVGVTHTKALYDINPRKATTFETTAAAGQFAAGKLSPTGKKLASRLKYKLPAGTRVRAFHTPKRSAVRGR